MKNNEGRTEDIMWQKETLDKKINLLAKRGGWKEGWDKIKKEGVDILPRPASINPNYLTHTCR